MRRFLTMLAILAAGIARAADVSKPNTLTPQEIADGWISLFDGETTFGWKTVGDVAVRDGVMAIGGAKDSSIMTSAVFGRCKLAFEFLPAREGATALFAGQQEWKFLDWNQVRSPAVVGPGGWISSEWEMLPDPNGVGASHILRTKFGPGLSTPGPSVTNLTGDTGPFGLRVAAGHSLPIRSVRLKPLGMDPIFNGKDLTGWKRFTGNERQAKSEFTVTPEGWIHLKNGPGDLQTEKEWKDFAFQGDCISNGKALNSGVFFRCLPGKYQQGYEYQIQNGYKDKDRTKPADYGTGAIYNRVKARKVVPNDHEWFTMTLIANGNHISTWVNGYQTVDWTDTRPPNDNARNGCKLGAGPISLQGHDKTTDLSFRNLRIAELKTTK